MSLKEQHDITNGFMFFPGLLNSFKFLGGNARDLKKIINLFFKNSEGLFSKVGNNSLGGLWTDAFNEAGAEILLKGRSSGWFTLLCPICGKLSAKFWVVAPAAVKFHGGSGKDFGLMNDHRYRFKLIETLYPEHTPTVRLVMKCDTFNNSLDIFSECPLTIHHLYLPCSHETMNNKLYCLFLQKKRI